MEKQTIIQSEAHRMEKQNHFYNCTSDRGLNPKYVGNLANSLDIRASALYLVTYIFVYRYAVLCCCLLGTCYFLKVKERGMDMAERQKEQLSEGKLQSGCCMRDESVFNKINRKINPIKEDKCLSREFSKVETQMAKKCLKKCSTSFFIR